MDEPYLEKVDVFLPGQGDVLTQAPAYHWEPAPHIVGRVHYSTKDPDEILVVLHGLSAEQRAQQSRLKVRLDTTSTEHHAYDGFGLHLPGLIATAQGTAIALCQQRYNSMADCGHQIDILVSRSEDNGKTWQPQKVLFAEEGISAILGPTFEDRSTGTVFVSFWKMPVEVRQDLAYFAEYARQGGGFWLLKSADEGQSWSDPFYVCPQPNDDGWVGWTNNCVHGIQLAAGPRPGRLVIPAFLYKEGETGQVPGVRGGLLYSDDHGHTWKAGAVLPEGSDEVNLAETTQPAGGLYLTYRKNTRTTGQRHFARSSDGGETFHEHGQHADVACRNLHAGLTRYAGTDQPDILLFSNPPAGNPARGLTVRLSRDQGKTWPVSRIVEEAPCRYSDLAVAKDGTILCIYTTGRKRDREKISLARFNLEWLNGK